jgi:class 3 adenylate cyclase/tetratricopeptide (TPR) repeat protein
MKCPKCQVENPDGMKFCGECGTKLERVCPQCNFSNPPQFKFCGSCGHPFTTPIPPPLDLSQPRSYTPKFLADKILTTRSAIQGEHKLVTVLFADVANFTALSEKLEPEDIHGIMDGCFKILMDEIHKYEGTINQFTGDGVMALFGAPLAHEDHAMRACHAALSIQKALADYGEQINREVGFDFRMRIGLNSGPVVVGSIGDDLRMDYTAIGDTINLTARVQQAATAGEVWISQATHNLVQGFFQDELVGDTELKGKAQPQKLFRVVAEHPGVRTRFDAGIAGGMTKFVGRRLEIEALKIAFDRAKEGEARVVDVVGEAGVGKSRLVYEFQTSIGSDATILTGICVQYGRVINFLPVIDVVKAAFGIRVGMDEDAVSHQVTERSTGGLAAMVPFYRNLLSLKAEDSQFNSLNPEGRKFGTFEAVKNLLLSLSKEKPLLLFIEDVHWMDKISEEFFTYLSRCIQGHRIMMITAYRPEVSPPWAKGAHYQRLGLETLGADASLRLVRNLLGGLPLEPALEQLIMEKTGGNPFFVEEIVRNLLDRKELVRAGDLYVCSRPIDQCAVPDTVQGILAARMDHLSEDLKQTMQVASVIGRDFAFRLLKGIMELGEELRVRLTNLVGLEILYEKALYPELEYIFKNALTQEVAYESLLKQRRQEIHGRIARTIENVNAYRLEPHYELLAHHYERSGQTEKAIEYLMLAAEKSNQSMAAQTACIFYSHALKAAERSRASLDPDIDRRLHQGLASASVDVGDISGALENYGRAMDVCQKHGMVTHEMEILVEVGLTRLFTLMEREEAIRFYEKGIARAREVGDRATESRILSAKGFYLSTLGYRFEGYTMAVEADALALQASDPRVVAATRGLRAFGERWLGRPGKAVELTEGLTDELNKIYNLSGLSALIFSRGLSLAEMGRIEDAISALNHGVDLCEKLGSPIHLGRLYNTLGYCYGEIHRPEEAWKWNLKSEAIARRLMEQYPTTGLMAGEIVAQASVNLMENLFDQGKSEEVWKRIEAFKEGSKSPDYYRSRDRWTARLDFITSLILLQREKVDEAEVWIREHIEISRREHTKKIEGRFLRLLGEVQMKREESDNAISSMGEAILILKEVGNPRQLWEAHACLASVYNKLHRQSEARDEWTAAAGIIHKTANGLSDRNLQEGFLNARSIREILTKAGV